MTEWVKKMSSTLDTCTRRAVKEGIQRVVTEWAGSKDFIPPDVDGCVTLPIRPLIVGGDDITVLCHVSYAMTFVEEVKNVFETSSNALAEEEKTKTNMSLWPATDNKLTISAGVLYCPVHLPLHTAIGYTEALLALAKGRGRKDAVKGKPAPACLDWEQITDSIVDTPIARRQRELIFIDEDINKKIKLTSKPCTMDEYDKIVNLSKEYCKKINGKETVPSTIRHKILPAMRKGLSDRLRFVAEIAKNHPMLAAHLSEPESGYILNDAESKWYTDGEYQVTTVIDALLLLEEKSRMKVEE